MQAQEQKSSKTTGWFVGVNPLFCPSIELFPTKQSLSATDFSRTAETIIHGFDFPQVIRILKA